MKNKSWPLLLLIAASMTMSMGCSDGESPEFPIAAESSPEYTNKKKTITYKTFTDEDGNVTTKEIVEWTRS